MSSANETSGLPDDEEACTLRCQNGSTCALTGSSLWGKKDGMHCICPEGFAGIHCELTSKVCGEGEHVCLTGSTCVEDGDGYRCECGLADESGSFCQHHRTEFCVPDSPHIEYFGGMAVAAFCINDGKCTDIVLGDDVYVVSTSYNSD
jgi:EGF-like domain